MGLNYYRIVRTILIFRRYWINLDDPKLLPMVELLTNYHFDENDEDWECVPDGKELAEKSGLPKAKINTLLKKLYAHILDSLNDDPPQIKESTVSVWLSIPSEEIPQPKGSKRFVLQHDKKAILVKVGLPHIPRIGEEINLEFLEDSIKWNRGYVHNVRHEITGYSQDITIEVHPFNNEYYRWKKLENDFEWREKRRREIN